MQGPDFKVGKTDIIDAKGNRVVTETTNENTLDGKSIWTIKQEFDYDNDGKMDFSKKTTETYDTNTGKLLNKTIESNSIKDGKSSVKNIQNLYKTKTGNLVKRNMTIDYDSDGTVDDKVVTRYEYNNGRLLSEGVYKNDSPIKSHGKYYAYHTNGEVRLERTVRDFNDNGEFDGDDVISEIEYDKNGKVISRKTIKPNQSEKKEEPAKAEEKPQYELPTYKPYEKDKKNPPMMGV